MSRRMIIACCLSFALLLLACSTEQSVNTSTNQSGTKTAPSPAATKATETVSADKIGVAECDDFIAKYDACVTDKVPEVARAQYKSTLEQWRNSWRTLAANPQTRASLAQACKTAAEQARTSMKTFNCNF